MNVANPTFEEMARHWFATFGTNPSVESFALALGFELQVDGLEYIWLISGVVLRPHIPVVTWSYITFGDGGQGRVNCEEMIKVGKIVTFKCVALVKPLGSFCSLPYLMCVRRALYAF
jgi:hypothetical protein